MHAGLTAEIKKILKMAQKTSSAVSKWLKKQEWYESFIETLERFREYDREDINRFLKGTMLEDTIYAAFPWYLSPEGMDFWKDIDKQFRDWFYGD